MNNDIENALDRIPDAYIQEAAGYKKRRLPKYFGAIAAALALVITVLALQPWGGSPVIPTGTTGPQPGGNRYLSLLAAPVYPEMVSYSDGNWQAWNQSLREQYDQPEGYADSLNEFFLTGIPEFLAAAEGENAVCSPVNIYLALAMLAECAEGNSRQQILALLGADSIAALREQAGHVWNAHYRDDGVAKLQLGNSLWLDEAWDFRQDTVDLLADSYYASVFRGDLGSEAINEELRAWINEQTGGLLQDQAGEIELDPMTVLALASTIQYQVYWDAKFDAKDNTIGDFYGPSGSVRATYMNDTSIGDYYLGENFTAVYKLLQDGNKMWLILPNKGIRAEELLQQENVFAFTMGQRDTVTERYMRINLSLPKFDITSKADLVRSMENLGVTDIFQIGTANFDSIFSDSNREVFVNKIDHAARVGIDEDGVTAAAFTAIYMAGAGQPEDEVDFVLDRPFVFVITSQDGLPLFTGVVNQVEASN